MQWPTGQDYNEAIQNPSFAFDDQELKKGTPELTQLGLPKPITGGFASVYKLQCGPRNWAVRCFLREFTDHQERYAAISSHLAKANLRYTVGFEFLTRGIRIAGRWLPVMKMEWVAGSLLNQFLEANLRTPNHVLALARRWIEMIKALRDAGISHGDLQHGNVLISNGEIRLIDYDGMFVPALSGRLSHEVGHRNYQHPLRTSADYGSLTDNFSAWVIYVSLLIIGLDPSTLKRFGGGEEFLIFQQQDYRDPLTSQTFAALAAHRDRRIQDVANIFKALLFLDSSNIPSLIGNEIVVGDEKPIFPSSTDWLSDHVPRAATGINGGETAKAAAPGGDISWLFNHLTQDHAIPPRNFKISPTLRGVAVGLIVIACTLSTLLLLSISFAYSTVWLGSCAVAAISWGLLALIYWRRPEVTEARLVRTEYREQARLIAWLERASNEEDKKLRKCLRKIDAARKRVEVRSIKANERQVKEHTEREVFLRKALRAIGAKKSLVDKSEGGYLKAIQNQYSPRIAQINGEIAALTKQRADDEHNALKAAQDAYFEANLRHSPLSTAVINGIGPLLKQRLFNHGVRTAADVSYSRVITVPGIGSSKAYDLNQWREALAAQLRPQMPTTLSTPHLIAVRTKYHNKIIQLEADRATAIKAAAAAEQGVRLRHESMREPLSLAERSEVARDRAASAAILAKYTKLQVGAAQELRELKSLEDKERASTKESKAQIGAKMFGARWRLAEKAEACIPLNRITFFRFTGVVLTG